jgi:hypothetical protein
MNKSKEFNEDILTRYIKPGKAEKAPAGFTARVMTRIQLDKVPSVSRNRFLINYKVPLIYSGITIVLILSAVITSSADNGSAITAVLKPLSDLINALPKINFERLTGISMPGWIIYIMIGIFMLSIFDRALNKLFHRERK